MILKTVKNNLLIYNKIKYNDIYNILSIMKRRSIDYADLYFQSNSYEEWLLEDRIIKKGNYSINEGVGARIIHKDRTGFCYIDEINLKKIEKSVKAIANIVEKKYENNAVDLLNKINFKKVYSHVNFFRKIQNTDKIELLRKIDNFIRTLDHRIQQVTIRLSGNYEQVLIAATDNTLCADIRPLVNLSITVLVEDKGRREIGISGCGGRHSYKYFFDKFKGEIRAIHHAYKATRIALTKLSAINAPAGMMPVILGPGWPGVLLHEAIGHGLEGDFIRKNTSVFSNKLEKRIASKICTVVDDSTMLGRRGSLSVDDEGVPGLYKILIKKGILKNFMLDKMNGKLLGKLSTGNGRRQSYAHLPIPRMTNTYMLPGKSTPQEIISSIDEGIYASNFEGGQVDITSGKFVFSTSEAYLIKKGRITNPIKNATLIGSGEDIMKKISMVGNDLKLDDGIGTCGKAGQFVPVGVGQPTLKIDNITVGGKI